MKIETILGAFIAATILFLTGFMAMFQQNEAMVVADIKQGTWLVLGIGAVLSFLKDFQALTARRMLASITASGNTHAWAGWLVIGIACLSLTSCGITRPNVDSINDAIVVTAADIETAATETRALCGNTRPGGPCAAGAAISTATKDRIKDQLQVAQDNLVLANRALVANDSVDASNQLGRAEAILLIIQQIIQERAR